MQPSRIRIRLSTTWMPRNVLLAVIATLCSASRGDGFIQSSLFCASAPTAVRGVHVDNGSAARSLRPLPSPRLSARGVPCKGNRQHASTMSAAEGGADPSLPQVWASSISTKKELVPAIQEAARKALAQLPEGSSIDLALVHVSSIYGNAERLEKVVPELRKAVPGLSAVVGCTSAGAIGMQAKGRVVEIENRTCLGLTLATLPGVKVQPFYLAAMDVPDPFDPPAMWKRAVGMRDTDNPSVDTEGLIGVAGEAGVGEPIFMVYATPQSIDSLGDYIAGMDATFPRSQKIGAMASTVSRDEGTTYSNVNPAVLRLTPYIAANDSLTRSCVFFGEGGKSGTVMEESSYYKEGMVGVSLTGDIRMRSFVSQGARRVGPTFHADKVDGPVVKSLRVADRGADNEGQDDWVSPALPPLAMIKQVQKKLSDEDKQLVQNSMLVGVAPELIGDTADEIRDISTGKGERFIVQGVLRTSMRDGAITIGNSVEPGTRLQLFVRDRIAAGVEFSAALVAYKRRELMETLSATSSSDGILSDEKDDSQPKNENVGVVDSSVPEPSERVGGTKVAFRAAGGLVFPGLDRGRTLWAEDNYQSSLVLKTVPVPLGGFFTNGVAGSISEGSRASLFGSSTAVAIFSPITARRTTVEPKQASADGSQSENGSNSQEGVGGSAEVPIDDDEMAMSDDDDDFVVQRRDVSAGRAVTSGPVLYSVAESVSQPRNSLEALVWEKEAEVDRFRDRWPMSMLVSRARMFNLIEENKPRDVLAALGAEKGEGGVAILAEIKRKAPVMGPMRPGEINVVDISGALEGAGVAAIAVNTDRSFFGCTYDDLTSIRSAVGLPVMCSDVMVYPYQIYQARLAGADAIKLIAPALPAKDLMYFHKIAGALGMQSIVAVSSVKQMLMALRLPGIRAVSINNRNMATWTLDTSRVDRILSDPEVQEELKGKDITLLAEGGLKTKEDIERVKAAGISCVVIGEAILKEEDPAKVAEALLL